MTTLTNPVLRGFAPDPSMCRVGRDYYIATSTFEWFPGVRLHHSRDLVHWRVVGHALTRRSQLDMRGVPPSGGIWAPCLTHANGQFWLLFTNLNSNLYRFTDCPNFLVTAPTIEGPWSEPIYLNRTGFDPSLFHDDDGRKWLVQMEREFRPGRPGFTGILLQEYDPAAQTLVGPVSRILPLTPLGFTEGPHLYRRNGWYYLLVAEGGTSYGHACTLARSRTLTGPYELDPASPFLSAREDLTSPLQRTGHGSLIETPAGEWWMSYLCARPWAPERRTVFGRETALARVVWSDDDWLRLPGGGKIPPLTLPAPDLPPHPWPPEPARDNFDAPTLAPTWFTLRDQPASDWLDLATRPGHLRLRGRESPVSLHARSVVARPLRERETRVRTSLDFAPPSYRQFAGLTVYRDLAEQLCLYLSRNDAGARELVLMRIHGGPLTWLASTTEGLPAVGPIQLEFHFTGGRLRAAWSAEGDTWHHFGPALDASEYSDETCALSPHSGTLVGLFACDLDHQSAWAEFDWFEFNDTSESLPAS